MQFITTKYHGPTNTRQARVMATTSSGIRLPFIYDHALNRNKNHNEAAKALATRLNWYGTWVAGQSDKFNVYICLPRDDEQVNQFVVVEPDEAPACTRTGQHRDTGRGVCCDCGVAL